MPASSIGLSLKTTWAPGRPMSAMPTILPMSRCRRMKTARCHGSNGRKLMQAAAAGDGVALVPAHLAGSHIERGHLINPFAVKFDKGPSYWLVRAQRGLSSPAIRAFCAWLRAEAGTIIQRNRSAWAVRRERGWPSSFEV